MANNFTIEGRASTVIKDIQRTWMWEVTFPGIASLVGKIDGQSYEGGLENELTCRAKSVTIPARGLEMITSEFGAFKQYFPGKYTMDNTVTMNFEESESGNLHALLIGWQDKIFNLKSGHSQMAGGKRGPLGTSYVLPKVLLSLKNYAGEIREKKIIFQNVILQNVGSSEMSYADNGSQMFGATFQFDLWFLAKDNESLIAL